MRGIGWEADGDIVWCEHKKLCECPALLEAEARLMRLSEELDFLLGSDDDLSSPVPDNKN